MQERFKHHGSPSDGLPTGVRDELPGEAEGRSAESARADAWEAAPLTGNRAIHRVCCLLVVSIGVEQGARISTAVTF
jgi:hypothetical protein